jgi:hypothetical protein
MKVRCIKNVISNPDKNIINADMRDYLTVGLVFWVYGISFRNGVAYLYVYNGNHLIELPVDLFDIIEVSVFPEWVIKTRTNGDVTLWPELFYREDFLENFSEHEAKERSEFASLQNILEQQK